MRYRFSTLDKQRIVDTDKPITTTSDVKEHLSHPTEFIDLEIEELNDQGMTVRTGMIEWDYFSHGPDMIRIDWG